jgi:hypothetical protein
MQALRKRLLSRQSKSRRNSKSRARSSRRSLLEILEARQMLTGDSNTPRILGLSAGTSAIYQGDSMTISATDVANPSGATPFHVNMYLDNGNGVFGTGDTLLGTATSGSGGVWSITCSTNSISADKHLIFAQADNSHELSNVVALPINILSAAPSLEPIDNDIIVKPRLYVMQAKADLRPTADPTAGDNQIMYTLTCQNPGLSLGAIPGLQFHSTTGVMIWDTTDAIVGDSPYHFRMTAANAHGTSQVRDFYLTLQDAVSTGSSENGGAGDTPPSGQGGSGAGAGNNYFVDPDDLVHNEQNDYMDRDGDEPIYIDNCGCNDGGDGNQPATTAPSQSNSAPQNPSGQSGGVTPDHETGPNSGASSPPGEMSPGPVQGSPPPAPLPPATPGLDGINYNTQTNPHPIIAYNLPIERLPTSNVPAAYLEATAYVWDHSGDGMLDRSTAPLVTSAPVFYSLAGVHDIYSGPDRQSFHLAIPVDASTLRTGRYQFTIDLTFLDSSGNVITDTDSNSPATETIGSNLGIGDALDIVNRTSSPLGNRWAFDNFDSLKVYDDGVMLVRSQGTGEWFEADASDPTKYVSDDDTVTTKVTKETDGTFKFTSPDQSFEHFDAQGRLIEQVDQLSNATTYAYYSATDTSTGALPNALKSVTDPFGRTETLAITPSAKSRRSKTLPAARRTFPTTTGS